jgi:hypothetical protein
MCTYTCIVHLLETLPVSVYASRTDHNTRYNTFYYVCHIYIQQVAALTDKPIVVAETSTLSGHDINKGES